MAPAGEQVTRVRVTHQIQEVLQQLLQLQQAEVRLQAHLHQVAEQVQLVDHQVVAQQCLYRRMGKPPKVS